MRTKSRAGRLAQQGGRQEEKVEEGGASTSIGAALAALARSRSPAPPRPPVPPKGRRDPTRRGSIPALIFATASRRHPPSPPPTAHRRAFPTPAEPSDAALHAQASPLLPGRRLECNLPLPPSLPPSPSRSSLALLLALHPLLSHQAPLSLIFIASSQTSLIYASFCDQLQLCRRKSPPFSTSIFKNQDQLPFSAI